MTLNYNLIRVDLMYCHFGRCILEGYVLLLFRHKSRSRRSGKTGQSSEHESMASHDTGVYFNTNSTESSGMRQRTQSVEHISADTVSPVCQPSEMSAPLVDKAFRSDRHRHDAHIHSSTSFEKTSTWLLQQDTDRALSVKEADVGLERGTQSSIYVGTEFSDVALPASVAASHSEPVLSQKITLNEDDVGMARSSVTIVASTQAEKTLAECHSSPHISTPSSHSSLTQKARQLRFLCTFPDAEDCPDVDGSHTFSSKNTPHVTEEVDGQQWVSYTVHNDVEELSVEDGVSVANSNTSLSDTCNSSFKSSTEDLANLVTDCTNENSMPAATNADDATPRISSLHSQHSAGLRHRKQRTANDSHSLSSSQQCEHVRSVREEDMENCGGNIICQEYDAPPLDAGGSLWQAADSAAAAVNDVPRAVVSSDDDDDNNENQLVSHVSPSKTRLVHPRHARRSAAVRTVRSNHNVAAADFASPKDGGVRVDSRRSNIRIMDIRLLESTGISSADSDGEAARLSTTKSASAPKVLSLSFVCCFETWEVMFYGFVSFFRNVHVVLDLFAVTYPLICLYSKYLFVQVLHVLN